MKFPTLTAAIAIPFLVMVGCQTPNQPNSVPLSKVKADLPEDWLKVTPEDWRMTYLDPSIRASLFALRKDLDAERSSAAFEETGHYSDKSYARMAAMNQECNKSFITNAVVVGRDLSPELAGTALSVNEAYMNSTVVGDVDLRQAQDDWARFWLMNKPSTLSPYPIINTGGRP